MHIPAPLLSIHFACADGSACALSAAMMRLTSGLFSALRLIKQMYFCSACAFILGASFLRLCGCQMSTFSQAGSARHFGVGLALQKFLRDLHAKILRFLASQHHTTILRGSNESAWLTHGSGAA